MASARVWVPHGPCAAGIRGRVQWRGFASIPNHPSPSFPLRSAAGPEAPVALGRRAFMFMGAASVTAPSVSASGGEGGEPCAPAPPAKHPRPPAPPRRLPAPPGANPPPRPARTPAPPPPPALAGSKVSFERDAQGRERVALRADGWDYFEWESAEWGTHRVHYIERGDPSKPTLLLIHGFGASAYHWRYNVGALSDDFHVLAVDMLGFGWSDKPLADYSCGELWVSQMEDFLRRKGVGRAVVAGNSLGGYVALALAARDPALVRGLVLLNSAGSFAADTPAPGDAGAAAAGPLGRLREAVAVAAQRVAVGASFLLAKQRPRIRQVLSSVYVDQEKLDDDLVESIARPADDPNAPEVFRRIITQRKRPVDELLEAVEAPVLLLWGMRDPWMVPRRADQVMRALGDNTRGATAEMAPLGDAGHCPHDDDPDAVNAALKRWAAAL